MLRQHGLSQSALFGALSSKVAGGDFVVVDAISAEEYKTKTMVKMLAAVGAEGKALVVLADNDDKVLKSFANIPGVVCAQYNTINVYDVLNCGKVVIAEGAVKKIEEVYA